MSATAATLRAQLDELEAMRAIYADKGVLYSFILSRHKAAVIAVLVDNPIVVECMEQIVGAAASDADSFASLVQSLPMLKYSVEIQSEEPGLTATMTFALPPSYPATSAYSIVCRFATVEGRI